jgi:protein-S-isoprenylcysteine O-methyltransferase Ste14
MQKIMPTTCLLIAIMICIVLHFIIPIQYILHSPLNLIGFLPLLFGVWINVSADRAFKKANTTIKPYEESSALVQDGVFGSSRNPMYLGFVTILLGISILLRSISPYLVVVTFAILMELVFIRSEEKMLQETFGDQWEEYRLRVRKWI